MRTMRFTVPDVSSAFPHREKVAFTEKLEVFQKVSFFIFKSSEHVISKRTPCQPAPVRSPPPAWWRFGGSKQ